MNHLDNIMKRYGYTEDQAEAKATRQYYDNIQTEARHIQDMLQSPGWAHFLYQKKEEERTILAALERASEPTSMSRLTGCLLVVKSDQTWAEDRLRALEQVLAEQEEMV